MRRSFAGPIQTDIALCERLFHRPVDVPPGVSFDDEYVDRFRKSSRDQQYVKETSILANTVEVHSKEWLNVDSIYGPCPFTG